MKRLFTLLFLCLLARAICAQTPAFTLKKHDSPSKIDGILSEPAWAEAEVLGNFQIMFPADSGRATATTEIRAWFDDKNLYIGAVCHQLQSSYTIQSRKRDFANGASDALNILISPYKDGVNGFLFGINPIGVQREALIDNGQTLSFEWDNAWYSHVHNTPDAWTAEIAIPFKTLRYKTAEGDNSWHINFVRTRLANLEISAWRPIPRQYSASNIAFCGDMRWYQPPPRPGRNLSFIPYATTRYEEIFLRKNNSLTNTGIARYRTLGGGADAKIGLTPALNLDLTFNPDFSQVEVDRQVANLSRFELFFPETRQFFLENRDLFAMYGFPSSRPFFSRRIGLATNPVTRQTEQIPIHAGVRLNGKLHDNLRIGVLDMQTKQTEWDSANVQPAANFFVATAQQKMFRRSFLGAFLVNKQNFTGDLSETQRTNGKWQPWNRVAGLEFNLYSADNRWEGEWYYHRSFSPLTGRQGGSLAHFLGYTVRRFNARLGYTRMDDTFDAEAGFVTRRGIQEFFPGGTVYIFPKNPRLARKVLQYGVAVNGDYTFDLHGSALDQFTEVSAAVDMTDQSRYRLALFSTYTLLTFDVDPTNQEKPGTVYLPTGADYTYHGLDISYTSSTIGDLQGTAAIRYAGYYNGEQLRFDGRLSYRLQPLGLFSLSYTYNRIAMPKPYPSAAMHLIGPKAELAFTKNFFASVFFQYNTQINNFNTNARLQWRYKPVSDVFLVYTGNTFAEPVPNTAVKFFFPKNNALVLKVVYWLNA